MHVGANHVFDNFSRGLVHKFYEAVVVHLMEGLVPDLNSTKWELAHLEQKLIARELNDLLIVWLVILVVRFLMNKANHQFLKELNKPANKFHAKFISNNTTHVSSYVKFVLPSF